MFIHYDYNYCYWLLIHFFLLHFRIRLITSISYYRVWHGYERMLYRVQLTTVKLYSVLRVRVYSTH